MSFKQNKKNLSIEDYFQQFVLENQEHMNETELAKRLGISRKNLWERRQRLGIPRKKSSQDSLWSKSERALIPSISYTWVSNKNKKLHSH